jgi:hypothetical protein
MMGEAGSWRGQGQGGKFRKVLLGWGLIAWLRSPEEGLGSGKRETRQKARQTGRETERGRGKETKWEGE